MVEVKRDDMVESTTVEEVTKDDMAANTTVGEVIIRKGMEAAKIMDEFFNVKGCCACTTHKLTYAAHLSGRGNELPSLLEVLNALPDIK